MENEVNWSERRKGVFEWRTISQDFLCSICILSPPCCIYPQRRSSILSSLILSWWLVWIETFLVVLFLCLTDHSSVCYQVTNGSLLWMTMWGQVLTFLARPCTVTFKRTFKSNILQVHSKRHLLGSECAADTCFGWALFGRLFISLEKKKRLLAFSS